MSKHALQMQGVLGTIALIFGALVAVAGTHLVSDTYGVAAIGNVFTHPDYRGRGYATLATGAVTDFGASEIKVSGVAPSSAATPIARRNTRSSV